MKRILVILLLIMYGTSSFGMTLHFHFCCGKLKTIELAPYQDKHCGSGKVHKMGSKPCCDTKPVAFKFKGEQEHGKVFYPSFHLDIATPVQPEDWVSSPVQGKKLLPEIFAPPPLERDFNHLYCIYRI